MRLNNGTADTTGSTASGSGASSPRREIVEVSDDQFPSQEETFGGRVTRSGRVLSDDSPRYVNDLRNGRSRSATPAKSVASSQSSWSSVLTHQTAYSQQGSDYSRVTSGFKRRRGINRREIYKAANNEPHPFGLESRSIIGTASIQHVQEVLSYKETTSVLNTHTNATTDTCTDMSYQLSDSDGDGNHKAWYNNHRQAEYVTMQNASSRRGNFFSGLFVRGASPYSSDSDVSMSRRQCEDATFSESRFASFARYVKRLTVNVCTYIYLFLVGIVYFEKWCLYVKRRDPDGGGINGYTDRRRNVYAGGFLSEADRSEKISSNTAFFTNNHNSATIQLDEISHTGFLSKFRAFFSNIRSATVNSLFIDDWSKVLQSILKRLLRVLLVILLLLFLLNYGRYLWVGAASGCKAVLSHVGGAFSLMSSALTNTFGLLFVTSKSHYSAQPIQTPNPSSPKTDQVIIHATTINEDVKAELQLTKTTIDALRSHFQIELDDIKGTLGKHEDQLTAQTDVLNSLKSEITMIIAAMKAASAKEKSVEQIIQEVLSVTVGETEDGKPVSLNTMFGILSKKEELERISHQIEIRSFSESIQSIDENFNGLSGDLGSLKTELNQINSRITKLSDDFIERGTKVEMEVDTDKVKAAILPVLMSEIQSLVSLSCAERKCPEGSIFGGLSAEDIEKMIKRAIAKYDADKTGLPDLALESAGGSILSTRCTKSSELRNSVISYWGFRLWSPPNTPRTIIQPGVVPGECWAFEGSVGDVVIKLAVPSLVTGFTLEHIPKSISRNGHIDSAPKHFQVLVSVSLPAIGVVAFVGLLSEHDTADVHDYGSFTYEDNDEPLQYFQVTNMTPRPYPIVELKVLSNHGNMKHTCIYRFRVHGAIDLARSQAGGKLMDEASISK